MTLAERIVEAARERVADATGCLDRPQCEGACHCRNAAIAALTAALAGAEAEGMWLVKVVGNSETTDCANPYPAGVTNSFAAYNEGFDDHRAATFAGRVTL